MKKAETDLQIYEREYAKYVKNGKKARAFTEVAAELDEDIIEGANTPLSECTELDWEKDLKE